MKKTNMDNMVKLAQVYYNYLVEYFADENFCAQKLMVEAIRVMNSNLPLWKKRVLLTVIDTVGPVEMDSNGYEYLQEIKNEYDFWKKRISRTLSRKVDRVTVRCIYEDDGYEEFGIYTVKKNGDVISNRCFVIDDREEAETSISTITEMCKGLRNEYLEYDEFIA